MDTDRDCSRPPFPEAEIRSLDGDRDQAEPAHASNCNLASHAVRPMLRWMKRMRCCPAVLLLLLACLAAWADVVIAEFVGDNATTLARPNSH
jgi:hypothetical protein